MSRIFRRIKEAARVGAAGFLLGTSAAIALIILWSISLWVR